MKLISRLYLVLLFAICFHADSRSGAPVEGGSYILYVGTYTKGESKGIYAYRFDSSSGRLTPLGLVAETVNPSFLAADPNRGFLYAVNEVPQHQGTPGGQVTAFSIDRHSAKLSPLNQEDTRGADPCYISLDKTGQYALVANYTGGSIAVFRVRNDGRLGPASAFIQDQGSGANRERQEGPHAHWIETTSDNRFALVADLGIDKLLVYHFDARSGSLTPNHPPAASVRPGAGPRHVAFGRDEKFAYVIDELESSISVFSYDATRGVLAPIQTISTLPPDFRGHNTGAEIRVHPDGKFLYASNRGHDSIAEFSIDPNTGHLTLIGHVSTDGKTPRHFAFDPTGSHLLVGNQDSSNIVVFAIDPGTGKLNETSRITNIPSPVCLVFVPAE